MKEKKRKKVREREKEREREYEAGMREGVKVKVTENGESIHVCFYV